MSDIVIDIETVGVSDMDDETRAYLAEREARRLAKERAVGTDQVDDGDAEMGAMDRLALELGLARVVAIGMLNLDTGGEACLCSTDEREILSTFWEQMAGFRARRIITFNGRAYDGPVLMVRSAQLGVACTVNLVPYRYDMSEHCDLAEVLSFQGAVWNKYSLDYWCRRFGIDSPKSGVSGQDVGRLYADGELDAIGEYVMCDVHATAALYERLRESYLWTFKGGPRIPVLV